MNERICLLGCGFVADLYMRSLAVMEGIEVVGVYDIDLTRLNTFCRYWNLPAKLSFEEWLEATEGALVLNLTNPGAHYETSKACLEAGRHVYTEKPLATQVEQARELKGLADRKGLMLASAPCSVLGETAQTMGHALRAGTVGQPQLIYAELDDGYVPQANYHKWISASGKP
ncbi:MAG: Gfo/Idh/MocA family oxidoreductase, partial [Myxococcota bacterium]